MPTLQQIYYLDITPEKFIDNCSDVELQEVILLANAKLSRHETPASAPAPAQVPHELPAPPKQVAGKRRSKSPNPEQFISKRGWTPEEDAILREAWPSTAGTVIAERLNRNYKVVMARASKLGLRKRGSLKRTGATWRRPEPTPEAEDPTMSAAPEPKPKKKMISVRVDKRTIVQAPVGTDVEKLKAKYNKS
jgi:hypothetical protein